MSHEVAIAAKEKDFEGKSHGQDIFKVESQVVGEMRLVEQAHTKRNIKSRHAQMSKQSSLCQ